MTLLTASPQESRAQRYLIITAHHDYRTPRRSSIHFIADELSKRGSLRFFSMRYSHLSKWRGDIRGVVDDRANQIDEVQGVECYLWKTPIHPFAVRSRWLQPLENLMFGLYQRYPSPTMVQWMRESDVVIYESGIAPIYFELGKRLNPRARHIYLASDDLETIQAASFALRTFARIAPQMDALCLVSPQLAEQIASRHNCYYVPHGLDASLGDMGDPSPYGPGAHAIAMGSMLFDPDFVAVASHAFPAVTFHVVGSGHPRHSSYGPNVMVYDHMPYERTVAYIKHATIGLAPYAGDSVPVYLAQSSMKMLQYDFFGLPTACPSSVVGGFSGRFGYTPGDAASISNAVGRALQAPHVRTRQILNWGEVAQRVIDPAAYDDTRMFSEAGCCITP